MTIQQCKYVLEIAKFGSFSEAAKHLFVAQSSLSAGVKALEEELNIVIFERSVNGVYLTSDGTEFIRYATQIADQSDFVLDRYESEKDGKRLFISTQHYDFVADIFGKMLRNAGREPYKFSLRETQTYKVIHEIATAYSDIGIIAIKGNDDLIMKRYLAKKGLRFTAILNALPHVYLRKDHPAACCGILNYDVLKDYPYVSYEQGEHNNSFFTEEITGAFSNQQIEISDRATLMNVLLSTDSYTVGTGLMPSALNNGNIVSVPLESNEFYTIGYILHTHRKISGLTEEFIKLLTESAKDIANI